MAGFIVDELHKSASTTLHYFFEAQNPASCTARSFLLSIVTQTVDVDPTCLSEGQQQAVHILETHRKVHPSSIEQCPDVTLFRITEELLTTVPSYCLVIDGLDDCERGGPDVKELLSRLALRPGCAILYTCRATAMGHSDIDAIIDLDSYPEEVSRDFNVFLKHEIESSLGLSAKDDEDLIGEVAEHITEKCHSNFLLAKQYIGALDGCDTEGEIRRKLRSPDHERSAVLYTEWLQCLEHKQRYDPAKLLRQRDVFKLIVAAREPLSLQQLNELLAVNGNPVQNLADDLILGSRFVRLLEELCGRFIKISSLGIINFFHDSAKTFIASQAATSSDEANMYLARKCLLVLTRSAYADPKVPGELLRKHLRAPQGVNGLSTTDFSATYNYAALYFHKHVSALHHPPSDLLEQLNAFLLGIPFVTWSEHVRDLKPAAGFAQQIEVRAALTNWVGFLSPAQQAEVQIEEYFEAPHIELASRLASDQAEDKILPLLPRLRLADFLTSAGLSLSDWQISYDQKSAVLTELELLLPAKDEFLLGIRAQILQDYFWQRRFPEALEKALQLLNDQREAFGEDSDKLVNTKYVIAAALIALGRYDGAGEILAEVIDRVRENFGEKDRFFNQLQLMEGARLERINDNSKAAATYEAALEIMTELTGPNSTFVLILHTSVGGVLRKQGKYEKAKQNLLIGWGERQIISSINNQGCLDAALQLAMLHRDAGECEDCLEVLKVIRDSTVFDFDIERHCQFEHIRNLVRLDQGDYDVAKQALMTLLQSASGENREKNNRELLWVRPDLADAMRDHEEDEEALMLFSDLVVPIDETSAQDEDYVLMEPKIQLEAAEKALRLVRAARFQEAQQVLDDTKLRWKRDADFWFSIQGGPTLDTSVMAPIRKPSETQQNELN